MSTTTPSRFLMLLIEGTLILLWYGLITSLVRVVFHRSNVGLKKVENRRIAHSRDRYDDARKG